MSKKLISLTIIVKNEEANIGRCIGSCEHVADEIIVVDTGCTDNTIKIAKSLGAIIVDSPWDNNFSKARNAGADRATGEWILYLDADEMLDFSDGFRLRDILLEEPKPGETEGYCLNLINVVNGQRTLNYGSLRLFRNRPEFRFRGRIHEQIFPSIGELYSESVIKSLDINFYHYGYDLTEEQLKVKQKRNLAIFNSYEESEKDGFYYYNFANEYTRAGDAEKALVYYKKAREIPAYDNGFKLFLPIYIVKCYYDLKRYEEAIQEGLDFLQHYPNYKDLNFLVGVCYYETNNFRKSKEYMLNYIAYSNENYGYPEFYLDKCNDINNVMKDIEQKIIETNQ